MVTTEKPSVGVAPGRGMGMVGNIAGATTEEIARQARERLGKDSLLGPYTAVHVFWLAGMSCDGCSIAVLGATAPRVEDLLLGTLPGLPQVFLHHTAINVEAGEPFMRAARSAAEGTLGVPYVVVYEGSVADEARAGEGYWSAVGEELDEARGEARAVPSATWLKRMAPGAAAVIAIGTCATWGGIPAAYHNPTGAMGVMDFLGPEYRSALGLPVVNIPGCAPVGDNFTETVAAVLLFLQGLGPVPEFDELGRPAWLFSETVHRQCNRAGYYEEGTFADSPGDRECLVEIGCWGPVVNCNITSRGAINGVGGCMHAGGVCIGCTMPGFPDKFAPFYKAAPGVLVSSSISKTGGALVRALRRVTQRDRNHSTRWDREKRIPSGWGAEYELPVVDRTLEFLYNRRQRHGTAAKPE